MPHSPSDAAKDAYAVKPAPARFEPLRAADVPAGSRTGSLTRFLPLALIVAGLGLGYALGWHRYLSLEALADSRDALKAQVQAHYLLSLAGFAALYVLAVALSFPAASILTIAAGFLFGWLIGGLTVVVSATLGATLVFLAARSAFGSALRARLCGKAAVLADGFEEDAFNYLLALRLAPVFPFFLMNIAPALFNVPVRTFMAATFLGIIPGTLAYAFLGEGLEDALISAHAAGTTLSPGDVITPKVALAFLALGVVALVPTVYKKLRGRRA